ncbi:hypothetical protein FRC03_006395 [Tulasnella sp. 419]|nr:hypothetical protein FRC03_006395 [Tulasnella sp. 419]
MSTSTVKRFTPTPGREFIWYWYAITAVVVSWDIGYCFLRPRSMPGGDLHWIWKPYAIYVNIDYIYGFPALKANNGFTNAQTFMNVIETGLNVIYVYLGPSSAVAPLIGFTSAAMTLAKTMLYFLQEYYCGWCMVGHNTLPDLLQYWILPNVVVHFPNRYSLHPRKGSR